MRKLATTTEVAKYLGVTPEALRQWAHKGTGPRFTTVESVRRYRWKDVEQYLQDGASRPAPILNCSVCQRLVESDGYIGVRSADRATLHQNRREHEAHRAERIEREGEFAGRLVPVSELTTALGRARWYILHRDCDPNPTNGDYGCPVEQVDTLPKFLSFLAHATSKQWVREDTDLPALIRRVIGE